MAVSTGLAGIGEAQSSAIPRRKFGRHSDEVSILGIGGHHLGSAATEEDAIAILHEAVDNGINFCDNAWEYNDHRSEEWMGKALAGGYRDKVFLMSKVCTHGRDASVAMQMLEESLQRLGTDHLDLWQIHAVVYDNDPDLAYRKGGVVEALDRAKQQGKVRYTGFTGHKDPRIHRRMIEMGYAWDSVQFPINAFDAQFRSFQQVVLPEALKRRIAVLGMKPLNGDGAPFHKGDVKLTPEQALRYAMSVPGVTTTITGMDSIGVLRQNLAIAKGFQPLERSEMEGIVAAVQPFAGDGRFEVYKTSLRYDDVVTRQMHEQPLAGAHS
ncbi:MAG: aldo/keto reductase [Acidobacteriaceae bacterium]|nr:aldo/keto reductase [Acidobacteriaceae bacterium]MBV9294459.1 aldo/keto reductase [Acidobacteriaceae bacterium]MBV9763463.1 aldo/keto reductase [Acidobacteriaceae bacterium]